MSAPLRTGAGALAAALLLTHFAGAQVAPSPASTPPSTPAPTLPFTLGGEVRTRSEWFDATRTTPGDAFTYLRARLLVRFDPTPDARIVLQAQDSRVLGSESSAALTARAADQLELHQGYLELSGRTDAVLATARAGRQEIAFGNERLVGAGNWTNTGRSFDGGRLLLAPTVVTPGRAWTAAVIAATIDERGSHFGVSTPPSTAADSLVHGDHFLLAHTPT